MTSFDRAWDIVKEIQYSEGGLHSCPTCDGRGQTTYTAEEVFGEGKEMRVMTCQTCKGTGQVPFSTLAARAEEKANQCICPEFHGKAKDRYGNLVPASDEQLSDWQDGVMKLPDGRYICSTCNSEVPMSG